jgi:hypothetical protein
MTGVPTWTVVIAVIFGLIGVAMSGLILLDPDSAPVTAGLDMTEEVRSLVTSYAIRNSITALVLLIAAWMRTPTALFAAVSGRMITELMDGTKVLTTGVDGGLIVVLVLLVPAGLVLRNLWPLVRTEMAAARRQNL